MNDLPRASIGRIIKKSGLSRVTKDAKIELANFLSEIGEEIAKEAVTIAENSGRKTVKRTDVELAVKLKL